MKKILGLLTMLLFVVSVSANNGVKNTSVEQKVETVEFGLNYSNEAQSTQILLSSIELKAFNSCFGSFPGGGSFSVLDTADGQIVSIYDEDGSLSGRYGVSSGAADWLCNAFIE